MPAPGYHRGMSRRPFFLVAALALCAACSNGGSRGQTGMPIPSLSFTQTTVGSRNNLTANGAWWGEHISKAVRHGHKTYTFAIDAAVSPTTAYLYEKADGGSWVEGIALRVSRPPNLLVDSAGFVRIIGFEPFDPSANDHEGRLFHLKFDTAETVQGAYAKEYISADWRPAATENTYATYYVGAAIGRDNTILVAYNNSVQWDTPGTHSLGARIRDPASGSWAFEPVAQGMLSRHAYPFAFVSDGYFHVYAVEDDRDTSYDALGAPYSGYPYRYGMVTHFQRARAGGPWVATTLIDFNGKAGVSKAQIWDASLRIVDFHVDAAGIAHALLRYKGQFDGSAITPYATPRCYHFWKAEGAGAWSSEGLLPGEPLYWARIWEHADGRLFFIGYVWGEQIWLIPRGTTTKQVISDLAGQQKEDATPFPASARGGTDPSARLYLAVFSGSKQIPALAIEVSMP